MHGSANLNVMVKAARKAGRSLVKDFREVEQLQVGVKGPGDFVSRADIASQKILKEELLGTRPNYGFLGEEEDEIAGTDPTRRWIVDPLDGTTNYLHGMPHWAVSVALEHKGEVVAGVVHDPAKDETFVAEKGLGAYLNEKRIRVSGRRHMGEAVFATGLPFAGRSDLPATLQDLARLLPVTAGVRRWGVASLDLAYVAAGRWEGFWGAPARAPGTLAAGIVIAREAGALVEPLVPGEDMLGTGSVIAAAEPLFDAFAKVIRDGGVGPPLRGHLRHARGGVHRLRVVGVPVGPRPEGRTAPPREERQRRRDPREEPARMRPVGDPAPAPARGRRGAVEDLEREPDPEHDPGRDRHDADDEDDDEQHVHPRLREQQEVAPHHPRPPRLTRRPSAPSRTGPTGRAPPPRRARCRGRRRGSRHGRTRPPCLSPNTHRNSMLPMMCIHPPCRNMELSAVQGSGPGHDLRRDERVRLPDRKRRLPVAERAGIAQERDRVERG